MQDFSDRTNPGMVGEGGAHSGPSTFPFRSLEGDNLGSLQGNRTGPLSVGAAECSSRHRFDPNFHVGGPNMRLRVRVRKGLGGISFLSGA